MFKIIKTISNSLYLQVLLSVVLAIIFASFYPAQAQQMKPLGDGFIKLIKMCVAPVIFCTIVSSFAGEHNPKIGRLGFRSLVYFEIVTTLALIFGLVVSILLKPGSGMNINLASIDGSAIADYKKPQTTFIDFILNIIPDTFFQAFVSGEILPVLLVSLMFGLALSAVKERVPLIISGVEEMSQIIFKIVASVVKLAPIGAFGAMSFSVGKYGLAMLMPLLNFMLTFYICCVLFILFVFGAILKICKSSIFKLIYHIKEEIFVVFGTCSSETALFGLIKKMKKFGCKKSIVGFVVPAGYSFNLDGTCIYFTMAIMFIAQAFNIELSWWQILNIIFILLITSKGAAGVVGSAFITLAATLSVIHTLPIEGLVLILGIDRFMSEARAITNLIGNATACVAISKWEGEFDEKHKNS